MNRKPFFFGTLLAGLLGICTLLFSSMGVAQMGVASPSQLVEKEVVLFLDGSQSIMNNNADSPHKIIASMLGPLFNIHGADSILTEKDKVTVYIFREEVEMFGSAQASSQETLNGLITRYVGKGSEKGKGLNTDMGKVFAEVARISSSEREKMMIFIIASDFLHDLRNRPAGECTNFSGMDEAVAQLRGQVGSNFKNSASSSSISAQRHFMALLDLDKDGSLAACPGRPELIKGLESGFDAQQVSFRDHMQNTRALLDLINGTITGPLLLSEVKCQAERDRITKIHYRVENRNFFPVRMEGIALTENRHKISMLPPSQGAKNLKAGEGFEDTVPVDNNIGRLLITEPTVQLEAVQNPRSLSRSAAVSCSNIYTTVQVEDAYFGYLPGKNPKFWLEIKTLVTSDQKDLLVPVKLNVVQKEGHGTPEMTIYSETISERLIREIRETHSLRLFISNLTEDDIASGLRDFYVTVQFGQSPPARRDIDFNPLKWQFIYIYADILFIAIVALIFFITMGSGLKPKQVYMLLGKIPVEYPTYGLGAIAGIAKPVSVWLNAVSYTPLLALVTLLLVYLVFRHLYIPLYKEGRIAKAEHYMTEGAPLPFEEKFIDGTFLIAVLSVVMLSIVAIQGMAGLMYFDVMAFDIPSLTTQFIDN